MNLQMPKVSSLCGTSTDDMQTTLKSLLDIPSKKIRGDWHHYTCFMCDDAGTHLGINIANGSVKCMRCNFRYHFDLSLIGVEPQDNIRSDTHGINTYRGESPYNKYSTDTKDMPIMDAGVDYYMKEIRGIRGPEVGYSYGRGIAVGCPVFNCYGIDNNINYLQFRKTDDAGNGRYCTAERGMEPRVDFRQPHINVSTSTLIVVEGPISSLATRQALDMWTTYNNGVSLKHSICRDIEDGVNIFGLRRVLVWFDDEPLAQNQAEILVGVLRNQYGVNAGRIKWTLDNSTYTGFDQASVTQDVLVQQFSRGLALLNEGKVI